MAFKNYYNERYYIDNFLSLAKRELDFYMSYYDNDTLLKWNNEYINSCLNKISKLLNDEINYNNYSFIQFNITYTGYIFYCSKETYEKTIEIIKQYINKYGYFVAYDTLYNGDLYNKNLNRKNTTLWKCAYKINSNNLKNNPKNIEYYIKDVKWKGLIANMYYLGYIDLIIKFIKEIYNPVREHFYEYSPYLKEFNLKYDIVKNRYKCFDVIDELLKEINLDSYLIEINTSNSKYIERDKKYYISKNGDLYMNYEERDYFYSSYDQETFLNWNNELVQYNLKSIKELLDLDINFKNFTQINKTFNCVLLLSSKK